MPRPRTPRRRFLRYALDFSSLMACAAVLLLPASLQAQDSADVAKWHMPDPARVLGQSRCVECHKSEVTAWTRSHHANTSEKLTQPKAPEYFKAIEGAGLTKTMCTSCHGTQRQAASVRTIGLGGVSCETCHGASGPEKSKNGWYSIHSLPDNKLPLVKREQICDALGMNRAADVLDIASNCYSCHTVPHEVLVNAGHPTSKSFELVEWSNGEVRHNFQKEQKKNADAPSLWLTRGTGRTVEGRKRLMYAVGQLVDLEVSLRNRATATSASGDFATAVSRRIRGAQKELEDMKIPEIAVAVAAAAPFDRTRLREVTATDKADYTKAADAVRAAAEAFAKKYVDGKGLEAAVPKIPSGAQGVPFPGS